MATFDEKLEAAHQALARGDSASAERILARLLRSAPLHSKANELMAYVSRSRGDLAGSLRFLETSTASPDASPTAWYYLGDGYFRHRRLEEAANAFRRALDVRADFFEALHELGRALHEQGRYPDATAAYERAIALNGNSFEALHNAGKSLWAGGRYAESLDRYDRALELNPKSPLTWLARGQTLHDLNRMDLALESYAKALALQPDFPEAKADEAIVRLTLGQWDPGWPAYEARWQGVAGLRKRHQQISAWHGERPIDGVRILAWCEQGLGDTLMFCRYVRLLMDEGAKVVLEVQPALQSLLAASFDCEVVSQGDQIPACDKQVPLMSMPGMFTTTPANAPANVPYLQAQPTKVASWSERVKRNDAKPKVAVACSGRAAHKYASRRQVSLDQFAPLAEFAHVFLVQKDLRDEDRNTLSAGDFEIDYLGDEIADFADSAAILTNMDLVVSVDTSLVHLAGALGKPVWILLADVPDWRWLLERADTPWYPTARLFRQERPGDWDGVFSRVTSEFMKLVTGAQWFAVDK
jgi:tetratricopeptide (TPR) repeat protein